jgi:cobalt-precorrin-5B (C1)-methyltransferase
MQFSSLSSDPSSTEPRQGYTLPVFACAASIAALQHLNARHSTPSPEKVSVDLVKPSRIVEIPVEQCALLDETTAIAITRSDPGDNLDLTRHTPIWAAVTCRPSTTSSDRIRIIGGEGIGKHGQTSGQAAIYRYATEILLANLTPLLLENQAIDVKLILPEGRSLATRTSNAAFGVVDGLSLLGTSGISEPLSAPGQLENCRKQVREQSQHTDVLVFCIGENGLSLARELGISSQRLIKTANWMGPLLVEAAINGVTSIMLFGYHGKLIKLAGGIFHTHHHLADGRHEILAATCVRAGMPIDTIQQLLEQPTIEDALNALRHIDEATRTTWVAEVYSRLVQTIDRRSQAYVHTHCHRQVAIGTLLFDRRRAVIQTSLTGSSLLQQMQSFP